MKTLYDLLGIAPDATQAQIEQGYKRRLDSYLDRQGVGKPDHETRRMQAIREAYLLLCSPPRRQTYDQQLRLVRKARTHVLNRGNLLRVALLLAVALALGAGVYVHRVLRYQSHAQIEQVREQTAAGAAVQTEGDLRSSEQSSLSQQTAIARAN